MYLSKKQICPSTALFDVPHKPKPMTAAQIIKKFPEFAKEMNGTSDDSCLLYFWKRNKETKIYEFEDEEAEQEVAEMLKVKIYDEAAEKEKAAKLYAEQSRALTAEEIQSFKEELAHAKAELQRFYQETDR